MTISFTTELDHAEHSALGYDRTSGYKEGYCKLDGVVRHFTSLCNQEIHQLQEQRADMNVRDKLFLDHHCLMRCIHVLNKVAEQNLNSQPFIIKPKAQS